MVRTREAGDIQRGVRVHSLLLSLFVILCSLSLAHGDHYATLGVSRSASKDDIRRAYRRLAKEHHPDKTSSSRKEEAQREFIKISEAYEVLSDDTKRREYDYGGRQPHYHRQYGGGARYGHHKELDLPSTELHSGNFDLYLRRPVSPFWIIMLYVDWSAEVKWFAPSWTEIVDELEGIVSLGHMDMMVEQRLLARKLGLRFNRAPVILRLSPDGTYNIYSGHLQKDHVTNWISSQYPNLIRKVRSASDISKAHRLAWSKTRVFISSARQRPSLLLRHLAYKFRNDIDFSLAHSASAASRQLELAGERDRANQTPVLYVFNNGTTVSTQLAGKHSRVHLEHTLNTWRHPVFPEIAGRNYFDLCQPAKTGQIGPIICVIVCTSRATMKEYWIQVVSGNTPARGKTEQDISSIVQRMSAIATLHPHLVVGWMDTTVQSIYLADQYPNGYNDSGTVNVLVLGGQQRRYKWLSSTTAMSAEVLGAINNKNSWYAIPQGVLVPENDDQPKAGLWSRLTGYFGSFPLLGWAWWVFDKILEAPLMSLLFLWIIASRVQIA